MSSAGSIDSFFSAPSARRDRWRELHAAAKAWAGGKAKSQKAAAALDDLGVVEEFHAFPGPALMAALRDRLQENDAEGLVSLCKRISVAIASGSYRHNPGEWTGSDGRSGRLLREMGLEYARADRRNRRGCRFRPADVCERRGWAVRR